MRFLLTIAFAGTALAQFPAPGGPDSAPTDEEPPAEVKPSVEKIGANEYRIGKITFDRKTREIRFPAAVNMDDGLLEFAIVHENGKIHESLLHTDISPLNLNVAFKLLSYPASRELYLLPNDRGGLTDEFEQAPEEVRKGARIDVSVEWEENGRPRKTPINDWIQHAVKGAAMTAGPWVYGGSQIYEGKFAAETTGDVAAIFITNSALINWPGDDNRDDTVWIVYPKRVPEPGTKVTVVIAPHHPTPADRPTTEEP